MSKTTITVTEIQYDGAGRVIKETKTVTEQDGPTPEESK